ncbi:lytic transglycosylase domain-containing protein [Dyella sp. KULCS107]|uniref:lytic transglycosylase domain-containing protein n=1 Tax=Dyella sp. KULCS107 TaxID=3422216 RepID=UPI003D6E5413
MFTGMEMTMCPNLAVPAEVMQHIVRVESGANPFAIGVVGGQLVRQPASLDEALATVQMLDAKGYDYSLGVAQVNRRNLGSYGLDTYAKAFDACANVAAGAQILAECYGRSGQDWGKAFSCYYSGNFVTGYRDGYVQRVYASMQADASSQAPTASPIPLRSSGAPRREAVAQVLHAAGTPGYRAALRRVAIDAAANAAVSAVARSVGTRAVPTPEQQAASAESSTSAAPSHVPPGSASSVFKPVVRGPDDPVTPAVQDGAPALAASTPAGDPAAADKEQRDAAFVF